MLQQTPVSRVLEPYAQWLRRWPRPADLAAEPAGEAVRAWGRLGYPRRALRLHAAAVAIVERFAGQVPDSAADLLTLPGIGEYTARAVAAFAFGARTPVVDTNVRRVLSRAARGVDSIREPATAADRRELESMLPEDPATAACLSVAIMELGALVCTATRPDCPNCPLQSTCRWFAAGRPEGTARRGVQTWHGTDRQIRGRMMALLTGRSLRAESKPAVGVRRRRSKRTMSGRIDRRRVGRTRGRRDLLPSDLIQPAYPNHPVFTVPARRER